MVAFTEEQLAADADNIVVTMGLRADWPNLAAISLAHSYGFSNLVLPLLLHGVPMVLAWSALPEAVRTAAAGMRDVTLAAVPALWRAWHEARAIAPQTRLAISAGAPLPLELEQQVFADTGLKIHNFYGSTECGGIAYDTGSRPREDAFTIGKPMRNVSLALAENGCLEVRSAAVGWGYWPHPVPSLGGGVFRTMDLCEMTAEGVRVLGRAGDQINVAGRKLSPETVEAALSSHPGVRACLVFGVPSADLGRGDMVVACVSAQTGLTPEELKQYALSRLPAWQVPREWWFVDSLPANARGKLPRVEWRERYLKRGESQGR